jgi:hypothetical protein
LRGFIPDSFTARFVLLGGLLFVILVSAPGFRSLARFTLGFMLLPTTQAG